jgi:hypothetical protein
LRSLYSDRAISSDFAKLASSGMAIGPEHYNQRAARHASSHHPLCCVTSIVAGALAQPSTQ